MQWWYTWLIDWLIGWLVDWLTGRLTDWLIDWLNKNHDCTCGSAPWTKKNGPLQLASVKKYFTSQLDSHLLYLPLQTDPPTTYHPEMQRRDYADEYHPMMEVPLLWRACTGRLCAFVPLLHFPIPEGIPHGMMPSWIQHRHGEDGLKGLKITEISNNSSINQLMEINSICVGEFPFMTHKNQ